MSTVNEGELPAVSRFSHVGLGNKSGLPSEGVGAPSSDDLAGMIPDLSAGAPGKSGSPFASPASVLPVDVDSDVNDVTPVPVASPIVSPVIPDVAPVVPFWETGEDRIFGGGDSEVLDDVDSSQRVTSGAVASELDSLVPALAVTIPALEVRLAGVEAEGDEDWEEALPAVSPFERVGAVTVWGEQRIIEAGAPVVVSGDMGASPEEVLPGGGRDSGVAGEKPARKPASGRTPAVKILNSDISDEVLKKAKRTAKRKAKAGHLLGGLRLTPRDYMMLAFLARYRVATVGQLARAFGTSETALRNRLPRLDKAGLITWAWGAQSKPKLWLITSAGLDTVGMDLTAPTVKWGQLRHTLGLVDLGINFESRGEIVITEREIRAAATRHLPTARMKSAIGLVALGDIDSEDRMNAVEGFVRSSLILPVKGRGYGHIPDMVLSRQAFPNGMSGNISIELELTRKSISEWKTILTTYRDSPIFAEVYYFVIAAEMKRSLTSVIKAIGASDKIKVINFNPVDLTADPHITGGGIVE